MALQCEVKQRILAMPTQYHPDWVSIAGTPPQSRRITANEESICSGLMLRALGPEWLQHLSIYNCWRGEAQSFEWVTNEISL